MNWRFNLLFDCARLQMINWLLDSKCNLWKFYKNFKKPKCSSFSLTVNRMIRLRRHHCMTEIYPRANKTFAKQAPKKYFNWATSETLSIRQEKSFPTRENFYLFAQRPSWRHLLKFCIKLRFPRCEKHSYWKLSRERIAKEKFSVLKYNRRKKFKSQKKSFKK